MPVVVAPALLISRSGEDSAPTSADSSTSIDDAPPKFPSPNASEQSLPAQNPAPKSPSNSSEDAWIINAVGKRAPTICEAWPLLLASLDKSRPFFNCMDPFYPQLWLDMALTKYDILNLPTEYVYTHKRCGRQYNVRVQLVD